MAPDSFTLHPTLERALPLCEAPCDVAVVIITRNRPEHVACCLAALAMQVPQPAEVIVVDSSDNEHTQHLLREHPHVRRLRIVNGRNNMPKARNCAIVHVSTPVTAFLDDDSCVRPGWLSALASHYEDLAVGGVGGRVVDHYEESRLEAQDRGIGMVNPDGTVLANFSLAPPGPLEVQHLRGCNMSFRTGLLRSLGGFDQEFSGPNTLEETDLCVRVRDAGYTLIFDPAVCVDHASVRWNSFATRPLSTLMWLHTIKNESFFAFKHRGMTARMWHHHLLEVPHYYIVKALHTPSRAATVLAILAPLASVTGMAKALVYRYRHCGASRFSGKHPRV